MISSLLSTIFDYRGVILFYSLIILIIYVNRDKFDKQGIAFLYRTKLGLHLMDKAGKRLRKFVKALGYIGIFVGYLGFFLITFLLVKNAYDLVLNKPGAVGGSPVIPGLPVAGTGLVFPLIIGWISLFIIMVVHEFSHGVVARAHNIKVKSSGLAFFGPIMGAFVEPDQKDLSTKKQGAQLSVFAAGPFSNILLWILCIGLILLITPQLNALTYSQGVKINIMQDETLPAYSAGLPNITTISMINDYPIKSVKNLTDALETIEPGDNLTLETKEGYTYNLTTVANPDNKNESYIGIWLIGEDRIKKDDKLSTRILHQVLSWLSELFQWTGFISINIGLINLFPIFITDGAQMLRANFESIFKDEKKGTKVWRDINIVLSLVIVIIIFYPLLRNIVRAII